MHLRGSHSAAGHIVRRSVSLAVLASLAGAGAVAAQQTHYSNPIIPGDWSDPGVQKVGDTYYSVRSSFGWQPGLQIAESRDLVNWRYAGTVDFEDIPHWRHGETAFGIWGSDIGWNPNTHKFLIYAPVRETDETVVWQADSPAGPWDGPYHIAIAIDPGVFVDDERDENGNHRLYVAVAPDGTILELTPDGVGVADYGRRLGPVIVDHTAGAEGPEIVKHNGWYYLLYSTGGTLPWEAYNIQTARTRDLHNGPWEFDPANPVMLANSYTYAPLHGPGHPELMQMPDGQWYITYHGFEITHYSLGRQKAMSPVEWTEDGWWRPRNGQIPEASAPRPALPWTPYELTTSDDFEYGANRDIGLQWFWNHEPVYDGSLWSLVERPGWLRIRTQPGDISSATSRPNVFLQRVKHKRFDVTTRVDFDAQHDGEAAGLHFYHDPRQSFWLVSTAYDGRKVFQIGRYWWDADAQQARRETLTTVPNDIGREARLRIRVDGEESATFWVADATDRWRQVGGSIYFGDSGRDRRNGEAGKPDLGWVGQWTRGNNRWTAATFGVFAVQDGAPESRNADFDYVRVATYPYINHPRPVPGNVSLEPTFRFGLGDTVSIPLSVHGGTGPYRWSAARLPRGLSLDAAAGRLHTNGRALARGSHRFEVSATDAAGQRHTRPMRLEVTEPVTRTIDCSREHRVAATMAELPAGLLAALREMLGAESMDDAETRIARITTCGAYREVPYAVLEMSGATPTRTFMLRAREDGTMIDNQTKPRGTGAPGIGLPADTAAALQASLQRVLGPQYRLQGVGRTRTADGESAYVVNYRWAGRMHRVTLAEDGRVLEWWIRHSFFDAPQPMRERLDAEIEGRVNPWIEIWRSELPEAPGFRAEVRDTQRAERIHLHFGQDGTPTGRTTTAL
jgi:xylan 1,4-beta-xylosidase